MNVRLAIYVSISVAACVFFGEARGQDAKDAWGVVKGQIVDRQNNGVKNVFVWLEPPQKGGILPIHPRHAKPAATTIEIDQRDKEFEPSAVAARDGDLLVAKNSSAINRDFRCAGDPSSFPGANVLLPPNFRQPIREPLKASRKPILVESLCHPWMKQGVIRVFDHPYYALTGVDGKFAFQDAPPGDWKLKVWALENGWAGAADKNGQPIAIKPGANVVPPIVYP